MRPLATAPPEPHFFFNSVASAASCSAGRPRPLITVTPLPLRPCVSRLTRTTPSLDALPGVPFLQTHSRIGRRQLGQRSPMPVEYTMPPPSAGALRADVMGAERCRTEHS